MANATTRRADLLATVSHALAPVTRKLIYVDTIAVLLRHKLSGPDFAELCYLNCLKPSPSLEDDVFYTETDAFGFAITLVIQRPTDEAILFLKRVAPGHSFKRFHMAIDFIVPDQEAADNLNRVLFHQVTQPNRARGSIIGSAYESLYWSEALTPQNMVAYPSRPCKITKDPCCHWEFRWEGEEACRRKPFYGDLANILTLDPIDFMNRHSRLSGMDFNKIEPVLDLTISDTMRRYRLDRRNARDRYYRHIVRAYRYGLALTDARHIHAMPTQAWLDMARDFPIVLDGRGNEVSFKDAMDGAVTHMSIAMLTEGAEIQGHTLYV